MVSVYITGMIYIIDRLVFVTKLDLIRPDLASS